MKNFFSNAAIPVSPFEIEFNPYCLSCSRYINHPLCPSCLSEGFLVWLKKAPHIEEEVRIKVIHFIGAHKHLEKSSSICVACNRNSTHTCPYCFTDFLYNVTKEAGAGVRHLSEFLFLFNFDFKHNGYSHDLEAFGGY